MQNLTPELIQKAKSAHTVEELLALAKENGLDFTQENANAYYAQLHPASRELSDDELDNVSGGGCGNEQPTFSNGDRAKLRDVINVYPSKCGSRRGIYGCDGSYWWLRCDTPNCNCLIMEQQRSVVEAAYLEKL